MQRPILVLDGRAFQSGISQLGAHAERGGIFYKATGVTPLFGAGSAYDPNNGLLMAGASGTAASYGSVTGDIMRLIPDGGVYYSSGLGLIGVTNDNELVKIALDSGVFSSSLSSVRTVGQTMTPGITVFDVNGARTLYYRQINQMGTYVPGGPTYTDAAQALTTDYYGAIHVHYGLNKVIFGNGNGKLGTIDSTGAYTLSALSFDSNSYCSAISDDGIYAVAAITRNASADATLFNDSQILYWDGSTTTGFLRNYPISDPVIYSIERTPVGVFAFGLTGIWQVTFDGVKKIFAHSPGIYTVTGSSSIHYGRGATSFFSDALIWGGAIGSSTARAIKSFGKLDSSALFAYLNPLIGTASKNITAVSGQISKGYVFVADDTPQLKYFPVGSGTPATSVTAQTVYFHVPNPITIDHIDVFFGEPLASGDTLDVDVYRDEDTAVTSFGAASYAANQTTRMFPFRNASGGRLEINKQFSLLFTFTAGAVKIKEVRVYGTQTDV